MTSAIIIIVSLLITIVLAFVLLRLLNPPTKMPEMKFHFVDGVNGKTTHIRAAGELHRVVESRPFTHQDWYIRRNASDVAAHKADFGRRIDSLR